VFDDLGAIAIIAIFYSVDLSPQALGLAAAGIGVLAGLNRAGVGRSAPYMLVFVFIWACVLQSGVHATLAGVVVGFSVPLRTANGESPLRRLEAMLHPWVTFAVLPLFALANAGVPLAAEMPSPVTLGIVLGLFVGKQAGVMAAAWLAVRSGLAVLPEGANWRSFHAAAVLTGIGFTMSLFIGTLALRPDAAQAMRTGVLAGSLLSAAVGYVLLHLACPQAEIAESGQK
jgi:NhaA family Na+:H+ antiporter